MQDKIRFYEEILTLEPSSKLFYPLARLYWEGQELEKAHKALAFGLEKHPEFMQARLLLLDVLSALGKEQELKQHMQQVWSQLGQSQEFWRLSAAYYQGQGDPDLAIALRYVNLALQGESPGWVQLLLQALQGRDQSQSMEDASNPITLEKDQGSPGEAGEELSADQDAAEAGTQPESSLEEDLEEDAEEAEESLDREDQYKTPTMAEILAEQGDVQGALEIYSWLLEQAESSEKREELQARMQELQQKPQKQDKSSHQGEKETASEQSALVSKLERLAQRLETRGQSGE
ncbi:MAG: hypothetical protein ACOC43_13770 [Desulfohalobiaceae bacterium]